MIASFVSSLRDRERTVSIKKITGSSSDEEGYLIILTLSRKGAGRLNRAHPGMNFFPGEKLTLCPDVDQPKGHAFVSRDPSGSPGGVSVSA